MGRNTSGQGLIEYLVLICLVAIACIAAAKGLGEKISERLNDAKEKITAIKIPD